MDVATVSATSMIGFSSFSLSRYSEDFRLLCRKFPGPRWDGKAFLVPDDLRAAFVQWLKDHKWRIEEIHHENPELFKEGVPESAKPWQRDNAIKGATLGYLFINDDMGLGKTASAILTCRVRGSRRVLVVTLASVRTTWEEELDKWWPSAHVTVYASSKEVQRSQTLLPETVHVVSYELARANAEALAGNGYDAIVVDESHRIKNPDAKQTTAIKYIAEAAKPQLRLALTGTPIAQEPKDLWGQVDFLRPGSFGKNPWSFYHRYCNVLSHQWGTKVSGARNVAELQERLEHFCCRVTKRDQIVRDSMPGVTSARLDAENKVKVIQEMAETCNESMVVFTFRRKTAHELGDVLGAPVITGELPPARRMDKVKTAELLTPSRLVCTMDSMGTGVNLQQFPVAVVAELSPKLSTMRQAVARIHRLSSTRPVTYYFVVYPKGWEPLMVAKLREKLDAITSIVSEGASEEILAAFTEPPDVSDKEWAEKLAIELADYEEDEYL